MSRDFNLFIKTETALIDIKTELEKILSISFTEDHTFETPEYRFEGLGLSLFLGGDHGFEDDLGINFSDYPFVIIISAKTKINMNDTLQENFSLFLFELVTFHYKWECLLAEDMQHVVRTFP